MKSWRMTSYRRERDGILGFNFGIILEETLVMDDLPDFPTAFFGLLYPLNIEYPKELKYTFEAVQNIFVGLGEKCTNRVQSLKNKLFTL